MIIMIMVIHSPDTSFPPFFSSFYSRRRLTKDMSIFVSCCLDIDAINQYDLIQYTQPPQIWKAKEESD